jgi:hypothetical protein
VPTAFSTYDGYSPKPTGSRRGPFRKVVQKDNKFVRKQVVADDPDLKPEPRRPGELDTEAVSHRTVTADVHLGPTQTEPEQPKTHRSKSLSLFDELFPEESQARSKREKAAEKRLDKLPAFIWNSTNSAPSATDRRKREREERRVKHKTIPQRGELVRAEQVQYPPTRLNIQRLRDDLGREAGAVTLPSLLVLNACSKNLEESDFFRLSSRGEHIQGWASGIIKGMILWCRHYGLEAYIWQSSKPEIETLWRNWVITLSSAPMMLLLEHTKTEQIYYTNWLDQ